MKKAILIPCMIFFFACKKNVPNDIPSQSSTDTNDPIYQRLIQVGFAKNNVVDLGSYYLVEGDMLFDKEQTDIKFFDEYFKEQITSTVDQSGHRHWITSSIVSSYNIQYIKMDISEFNSGDEILDWRKSSATAMTHWASINNTNINFVRYPSTLSGDRFISVVDDGGTLPDYVIAAAEWPTSGNPGFRIRVNLDYLSNKTISESQRVYNLVHELGHCIGFRHSDLDNNTESVNGATEVTTTSPNIDNNSVMKAGTAENTWNGFSTDDGIAAQTVYPVGSYTNWITSPNNGKYPGFSYYHISDYNDPITITWDASLINTATVTLEVYQNGVYVQSIAEGIPNTGSYSYPIMNVVGGGNHNAFEVQVRLRSDNHEWIDDFSPMFYIVSE